MLQENLDSNQLDSRGWQSFNERSAEILVNEQVRADFLANTRSIKEIKDSPPEERPDIDITCIDERANRVTVDFGTNEGGIETIQINTPGGGTEFLEDEDIEQIIMKSNGTIRISSHMFCGWGEYVFNEILNNGGETEGSDEEKIKNKALGIGRIISSITLAVEDPNEVFWGKYGEELEKFDIYNPSEFINIASDYLVARSMNRDVENPSYLPLIHQAFVHGKTIKLATRFRNIHQIMKATYDLTPQSDRKISDTPPRLRNVLNISTHIDTLEEAPHVHIADAAVINMTSDRVITSRFQIENKDTFFARVKFNKAKSLIDLIFKIMEGDHSDTREKMHTTYVFCDVKDKEEIQKLLDEITGENPKRSFEVMAMSENEIGAQNDPLPPTPSAQE